MEESTCFNLGSFPYAVDVDLSKKSLKKISNMTAANEAPLMRHLRAWNLPLQELLSGD